VEEDDARGEKKAATMRERKSEAAAQRGYASRIRPRQQRRRRGAGVVVEARC
jgi:hypothetical protein